MCRSRHGFVLVSSCTSHLNPSFKLSFIESCSAPIRPNMQKQATKLQTSKKTMKDKYDEEYFNLCFSKDEL